MSQKKFLNRSSTFYPYIKHFLTSGSEDEKIMFFGTNEFVYLKISLRECGLSINSIAVRCGSHLETRNSEQQI